MRRAVDIVQCAVGALRVLNVPDQPHLGPPPRHVSRGSVSFQLCFCLAVDPADPDPDPRVDFPGWAQTCLVTTGLPGDTWADPGYCHWTRSWPLFPAQPWACLFTMDLRRDHWTLGWPWLPFSGQPCFSRCGAGPHLSRSLPWYHIWFTTSWRAAGSFCSQHNSVTGCHAAAYSSVWSLYTPLVIEHFKGQN